MQTNKTAEHNTAKWQAIEATTTTITTREASTLFPDPKSGYTEY